MFDFQKIRSKENGEKDLKKKKIDLNIINYFYIQLQTHFTYFNSLRLNDLKLYEFSINFNYI